MPTSLALGDDPGGHADALRRSDLSPSEEERRLLQAALDRDTAAADAARPWNEVRTELWNDK